MFNSSNTFDYIFNNFSFFQQPEIQKQIQKSNIFLLLSFVLNIYLLKQITAPTDFSP